MTRDGWLAVFPLARRPHGAAGMRGIHRAQYEKETALGAVWAWAPQQVGYASLRPTVGTTSTALPWAGASIPK
jgi:hypothetical protein